MWSITLKPSRKRLREVEKKTIEHTKVLLFLALSLAFIGIEYLLIDDFIDTAFFLENLWDL